MATVLYLAHRLPFPPDKGDKVRTHHILRALAERHRVLLGTFVDDAADLPRVPALARWCAETRAVRLRAPWARLRALLGLLRGEALTLGWYRSRTLQAWVRQVRDRRAVDAVVVSSSSMAPYAQGFDVPVVMDFIDVDSAKWQAYAVSARWPWSWVYAREARLLARFERRTSARVAASFFVTAREAELFARSAPGADARVLGNGVDTDHFAPDRRRPNPYPPDELPLVFTGTMNYRPNVDAVTWFAREVLPQLRQRWPRLRLSVVGRQPTAEVRALQGTGVRVTGAVADVRPWLQHAAVAVAPMRIARGVQNKILEAMAMGRPLVAARDCVQALEATPGVHLAAASHASDYLREVSALLADRAGAERLGVAARGHVQSHHAWPQRLAPLHECLERCLASRVEVAS